MCSARSARSARSVDRADRAHRADRATLNWRVPLGYIMRAYPPEEEDSTRSTQSNYFIS